MHSPYTWLQDSPLCFVKGMTYQKVPKVTEGQIINGNTQKITGSVQKTC